MKFLKSLRSRSSGSRGSEKFDRSTIARNVPPFQAPPSTDLIKKLPPPILEKIFTFVSPHTQDDTYESCEQSAIEDACMLCDLRDLAHCVRVSRRWRKLATNVLYHSVRIDAVHYCEREEILAEKRRRGSFFDRNADPEDPTEARLRLLCRTVRNDNTGNLAMIVQFLKIPYMTREVCKADLARTVAVLPNLRYVDLPEGFYGDDPSCNTLKRELQARCPQIRKMSYNSGAERSFQLLASGRLWQNLEVLEISKLDMHISSIRYVLASLPCLRALKIKDMIHDDKLFQSIPNLPPFPPLTELLMENTPNLTIHSLLGYISRRDVKASLKTLSLTSSGVEVARLHEVLSCAPNLESVSVIEPVQSHFPNTPTKPALSSRSLKILHYEITSASSANQYQDPTSSYYAYLTASLLANGLPSLQALYVRDLNFPDSLLDFSPPRPAFVGENGARPLSSNNPFLSASTSGHRDLGPQTGTSNTTGLQRQLEVYTKGIEEMEWNFSRVAPAPETGRRGSMTPLRPVSAYGLAVSGQMSPSWTGHFGSVGSEVRKSVVVGNGFGGFLAVPADDGGRPQSSNGRLSGGVSAEKRGSRYDIWR